MNFIHPRYLRWLLLLLALGIFVVVGVAWSLTGFKDQATQLSGSREDEKTSAVRKPPRAAVAHWLQDSEDGLARRAEDYELYAPRRRNELGEPEPFRQQALSAAQMDALRAAAAGELIRLDLFPDVSRQVRVTGRRHEPDETRLWGVAEDVAGQDFFVMSWRKEEARGLLKLPSSNRAYEILRLTDGTYAAREWLYTDVVCARPVDGGKSAEAGMPPPPYASAPVASRSMSAVVVPVLNSRPSAVATIYLDFDGEVVSETAWAGGATIEALPARMNAAQIEETWRRVASHFAVFDVNVTTDREVYEAAPLNRKTHCVITPTKTAAPTAGGVAYVGSFTFSSDSFKICWTFQDQVPADAALISSHEIGHTLGLRHHGRVAAGDLPAEDYYRGHGTGETGWGPFMGSAYGKNLQQWSKGEYERANNSSQDDLAIMTRADRIPYLADDHGDAAAAATPVSRGAAVTGSVGTRTDRDFFRVALGGSGPQPIQVALPPGTMLDVEMNLYSSSGQLLQTVNPVDSLPAWTTFSATVAEDVLVEIRGTGKGEVLGDGYSDYSSLGAYTLLAGTALGTQIPFSGTYTFGSDGNVTSFAYNGTPIFGVTASPLVKVGVSTSVSTSNFRANDWPTGASDGSDVLPGSPDAARYFEFTVTAAAGKVIDGPSITFGVGRSGGGPRQWQWRSSADNYTTAIPVTTVANGLAHDDGVLTGPDIIANWTGNVLQTDGPLYENLTRITFRLYGYNAELGSGTGGLAGPLIFGGTLRDVSGDGPVISSFDPPQAPVGSVVSIEGFNFGPDPLVRFNGVEAVKQSVSGSLIVVSVPGGATTGRITVEVPGQPVAVSSDDFIVGVPPPIVSTSLSALTGFVAATGSPSSAASYSLIASNLTNNLVIGPTTAAFQVSTNGTTWASTLTLPQAGGALSNTVFVRLSGSAPAGAATATVSNSIAGSGTSLTNVPDLAGLVSTVGTSGLIYWNFATASPTVGVPVGWTVAPLSRGNHRASEFLYTNSASTGYINPFGVPASASGNVGLPAAGGAFDPAVSGYYEINIVPDDAGAGITNISFGSRSTGTGPTAYSIRSSADNFSAELAAGVLLTNSTWRMQAAALDVVLTNGTNTVRIYGHGGTAASNVSTANWRIDDLTLAVQSNPAASVLNVEPAEITSLSSVAGQAGEPQPFEVSGANLTGNLTITAPLHFEVSTMSPTEGFGSSAVIAASGSLAATDVWVRIASTAATGPVGPADVTVVGGGAVERTVAVSGVVDLPPIITASPSALDDLVAIAGSPGVAQSVTVTSQSLPGEIAAILDSEEYEVAEADAGLFAAQATLPSTGGSLLLRIKQGSAVGPVAPAALELSSGEGTSRVQVLVSLAGVRSGDDYDTWARGLGLDPAFETGSAAGAPTADPDGDGFTNLQEYAFGTSPIAATATLLSTTSSGGNLVVTWLERSDVIYNVQSATNLATTAFANDGTVNVEAGATEPEPPEGYTRKQFSVPATGSKFYRVTATTSQ